MLNKLILYYRHHETIKLNVSDEEMAKRKAETVLKKKQVSGYLKRYAEQVSSADKGAIINK